MTSTNTGTVSRADAITLTCKAFNCSESAAKDFLDKNFGPGRRIPKAELMELLKMVRAQAELRRKIKARMLEIRKREASNYLSPDFPSPTNHGPDNDGPSLG